MNKQVLALVAVLVTIAISSWAFKPIVNVSVDSPVSSSFGAGGVPDTYSEYTSQNGLTTYKIRRPLTLASTTPCAIQSPYATSTRKSWAVQVTTATATDVTTWTFATSTTAFATTSVYGTFSLAAGTQGSMVASTTATTTGKRTNDVDVVKPNTWFVVGMAGTVPAGTTNLQGTCSAVFEIL